MSGSISCYTNSDSDVGIWKVKVDVTLTDYPSVPMVSEYFWVQFEYCIINQIKFNPSPTCGTCVMTLAKNPSTPLTYELY